MKKTILGVITVVMLLVVMLSTSVNAASLSTDKEKMEKGDIVTVTLSTDEEVKSMEFELKFDNTKYKFVENSIKTDLGTPIYNVNGDTIIVSVYNVSATAKTLTLQFEALENGENVAFEISGTEFSNDEAVTNPKVEVTIEEKQPEEPNEPEEPVTPVEPSEPSENEDKEPVKNEGNESSKEDTETSTDNGDKYIDEDGNEITKLPQAGSLLPSIVLGIVVLGLATITGYKMIKNK